MKIPTGIQPTIQEHYVCYEPTGQYRYLCWVKDGDTLVPAYLIRKPRRPSCSRISNDNEKAKWQWNTIEICTYDDVTPKGSKFLLCRMKDKAKFDMIIKTLGPVGDVIEEWELKNTKIIHIVIGFNKDNREPETYTLELAYDYATLKY